MAMMNSLSTQQSVLQKHAARLSNVGGLLYQSGDCMTAMQCLQESVQTMMQLEDPTNKTPTVPSEERQQEVKSVFHQLLTARRNLDNQEKKAAASEVETNQGCHCGRSRSSGEAGEEQDCKPSALEKEEAQHKKQKAQEASLDSLPNSSSTLKPPPVASAACPLEPEEGDLIEEKKVPVPQETAESQSTNAVVRETTRKRKRIDTILKKFDAESNDGSQKKSSAALLDSALDEGTVIEPTNFVLGGIPGLFGMTSKIRGGTQKAEDSMLVFSEPFVVKWLGLEPNQEGPDAGAFYVPLDQTSRATLFNMGLIHYQWKSMGSAIQFFQLSLSMASQDPSPMTFNPIVLACLNNIGQILLQNGKVAEATAMFSDALSRGNAALIKLYGETDNPKNTSTSQSEEHKRTSRLLRRFLVRSLMNMGYMHFYNCEYQLAARTCVDAMRLLRPNMLEVDAAALWYNLALTHHHQHELHEALVYLDKYLDVACRYLGVRHLQVATGLHRKGSICFEMGNLYDSTKPMLQALRIRKSHWGNVHPSVADSLCLLGKIYLDREEFRYAKNALVQALSVQKSLNEGDSLCLDMAQTLIDLGRAYHSQGLLDDSLKAYVEVVSLTKKIFGEGHAYVARMQNIVGNILLEKGDVNSAVEVFTSSMRVQVDYAVVQNPHIHVEFSHHPTSACA